MDALALGYTLPAIGRVTDLHRLDYVHAGEQKNRLLSRRIISGLISLQVVLPGFEPGQTGPESVVLPLHHRTRLTK